MLTVSDEHGMAVLDHGGGVYKITESNAMYQTAPDRFGNYKPVIAISIIKGVNWILGETDATWLFNNGSNITKCLPR